MRANKRLGQHFLRDARVLTEIAAIADVQRSGGALEIGPGEGALTAFILRSGRPVVVLEKDDRAVAELGERFADADNLRIVAGDALTADLAGLLPKADADGRLPVVVGNLPFNVGSAIYRRLLGLRGQVARLVLMLQKEVAQRIVAAPGSKSYGIPSVMTALVAKAWMVLEVPPEAFEPRPKVDSGVVLVEFPGEARLAADEMDGFDRFASRLMQARRKVLANALDGHRGVLSALGIDPGRRPEQLTPDEMLTLYRAISAEDGTEG